MNDSPFNSIAAPSERWTGLSLLALGLVVVGSGVVYGVVTISDEPIAYVVAAMAVTTVSSILFATALSRDGEGTAPKTDDSNRLLVRMGLAELLVAFLLPLPLWGHTPGLAALSLFAGVFCNALLKSVLATTVEDGRTLQRIAGLSIVVDALFLVGVFSLFVSESVFSGGGLQYALVVLAALVYAGVGVGVLRGDITISGGTA